MTSLSAIMQVHTQSKIPWKTWTLQRIVQYGSKATDSVGLHVATWLKMQCQRRRQQIEGFQGLRQYKSLSGYCTECIWNDSKEIWQSIFSTGINIRQGNKHAESYVRLDKLTSGWHGAHVTAWTNTHSSPFLFIFFSFQFYHRIIKCSFRFVLISLYLTLLNWQ